MWTMERWVCSEEGWTLCLQALGLCLGTTVTLLQLSSFVCWAMAPTQLCRSGSIWRGCMSSKISRRPWKPPGVRNGTQLAEVAKREEAGAGGCCCYFWCHPPSCSSPGRWQWGVRAGGHISPPQGPATRHGVQGSAQSPTGVSGIPLPPPAPLDPPCHSFHLTPSAGSLPPPLALPVPHFSLPCAFLRVSCPLSSP